MPTCCVPYCKSGYESARQEAVALGVKPPSLFAIPKELLLEYQRLIKRDDLVLTPKHRVCSLHFSKDDIERFHPDVVIDGKLVVKGSPRQIPKLREGALPCVFPKYSKYLARTSKSKRKAPKSRDITPSTLKRTKLNTNAEGKTNPTSAPSEPACISPEVQEGPRQEIAQEAADYNRTEFDLSTVKLPGKDCAFAELEGEEAIRKINKAFRVLVEKGNSRQIPMLREGAKPCTSLSTRQPLPGKTNPTSAPPEPTCTSPEVLEVPRQEVAQEAADYNRTECDLSTVKLPGKDWAFVEIEGEKAILKINKAFRVTHSITMKENKIEVKIGDKVVKDIEGLAIQSNAALEEIVLNVNGLMICGGSKLGTYHKNCRGWMSLKALRCPMCKSVKNRGEKEEESVKTQKIKQNWRNVKKQNNRMLSKIHELKQELKAIHTKCNNIEKNKLQNVIEFSEDDLIVDCYSIPVR